MTTIDLKNPKFSTSSLNALKKKMDAASDKKLATIVQRIKSRNDTYAIDTGQDLLRAKDLLKHGEFGPWLKANFDWSNSTAQNYMNAAKLVEKNPTVGNLKPSALIALAAPSTPETVKSEVIADLEGGKVSTPKEVKQKIADAKPTKTATPANTNLVERLQAVGIDAAVEAMNTAFPDAHLELSLGEVSEPEAVHA